MLATKTLDEYRKAAKDVKPCKVIERAMDFITWLFVALDKWLIMGIKCY